MSVNKLTLFIKTPYSSIQNVVNVDPVGLSSTYYSAYKCYLIMDLKNHILIAKPYQF